MSPWLAENNPTDATCNQLCLAMSSIWRKTVTIETFAGRACLPVVVTKVYTLNPSHNLWESMKGDLKGTSIRKYPNCLVRHLQSLMLGSSKNCITLWTSCRLIPSIMISSMAATCLEYHPKNSSTPSFHTWLVDLRVVVLLSSYVLLLLYIPIAILAVTCLYQNPKSLSLLLLSLSLSLLLFAINIILHPKSLCLKNSRGWHFMVQITISHLKGGSPGNPKWCSSP